MNLKAACLFALLLSGSLAVNARALVPPEIPLLRTTQIYSPVSFDLPDMGRSVFLTGGVRAQGYEVIEQCVVTAPPTATAPVCGIDDLISMLGNPAGVLHLETHSSAPTSEGGRGGSVFMVEAYRSDTNRPDDPCHEVKDYLQSLIPGTVQADEMQVIVEGGGELCILRAEPIFVTRQLQAYHGIVHGMMCEGAQQWPVWVDNHFVRNYVSHGDSVYKTGTLFGFFFSNGLDRTRLIFENMTGTRNEAVGYGNRPISQAVAAANLNLIGDMVLHSDSIAPNAAQMRLYNAPRIVVSDLRQDQAGNGTYSNLIYRFEIGGDVYPYNPGLNTSYPDGGQVQRGNYRKGPLRITLRFSEPMQTGSPNFRVGVIPPGGGAPIPFGAFGQNGGWSSVNMPSPTLFDTWTGELTLPENIPGGEASVEIRAIHLSVPPGQDFQNQDLDTTGEGSSDPGNVDVSLKFGIDRTPPTFIMRDDDANGVVIGDEGTTGASDIFIQAEDAGPSVSGISAITVFGLDSEYDQVRSFSGLATADTIFTGVPDGYYWVIVEDVAGNQSIKEIRVARNLPAVSLTSGRINISGFRGFSTIPLSTLSRDASIAVTDSIGLSVVAVTGAEGFSFQRSFQAGTLSFQTVPPDLTSLVPGEYTITAENVEGHSTTINFRVASLEVEFLPGESESIYNGQAGLFAGRLKFRVNGTAPIREVRRIDPSSGEIIETLSSPGNEVEFSGIETGIVEAGAQQSVPVQVVAVDDEGNAAATTVNLTFAVVPPSPDSIGEVNFRRPSVPYVTEGTYAGAYLQNPRIELGTLITDGLTSGNGSGSHVSTAIDLFQLSQPLLPGAVILAGTVWDPRTQTTWFHGVGGGGGWVNDGTFASGPLLGTLNGLTSGKQEAGKAEVHLRTGPTAGLGSSQKLTEWRTDVFSTLDLAGDPTKFGGLNGAARVDRYFGYETRVSKLAPTAIYVGNCLEKNLEETFCDKGMDFIITVGNAGGEIMGQTFSAPESAPLLAATVAQGTNRSIILGGGVEIDQLNVTAAGELSLAIFGNLSPPGAFSGYAANPKNSVYEITPADPSFIEGSFRIKIRYDNSGLTPEQQSAIRVIRLQPNGVSEVLAAQNQAGEISFITNSFGQFMLLIPSFLNPLTAVEGDFSFLSNSVVTATPESPENLSELLNTFRTQGKAVASDIARLGPTGATFSPPGVVTVAYSPSELAQLGISEGGIAIYQFTESGALERLRNQVVDFGNRTVSARVGQFTSLFAVFGDITPVGPPPSPDTTPPGTNLQFDGPMSLGGDGTFTISTFTHINLQAFDPAVPNSFTSGVSQTFYSTAAVVSTATVSTYSQPFMLDVGTYSLTFFSIDGAGNAEAPQTARIDILMEGTSSPDLTPPVTTLGFSGAFVSTAGAAGIINERSSVTLTAVDSGIGQVQTYYAVDPSSAILVGGLNAGTTGSFLVYGGEFALALGRHIIAYGSADGAGNYETLLSTAVEVRLSDSRPPRTEFVVGLPSATLSGAIYVSGSSPLGFLAVDDYQDVDDGLGAGISQTFYSIDGAAFAEYSSSFTLVLEGTRTVAFFSVDLEGNAEAPREREVFVDLTLPVTQLNQNGAEISLDAFDPSAVGGQSGIGRIRYLVDYLDPDVCNNVAEDAAAAPGTCENPWYAGPFTLSNGGHSVRFQAFDNVGNAEFAQTAFPFVESFSDEGDVGGLGIGRDPLDTLWTVNADTESISFAHADSSGALISSAILQDAADGLPWSVFFNTSGRAYAIGMAEGFDTQALDLAIYKASPSGDAIESRTLFDSGYASNDLVFDAKAPGWIVGGAQTAGPLDMDVEGDRTLSLALWRFDPALGSVQLSTSTSRAGFDFGSGLAVDTDGSLWIVGYSAQPNTPDVGGLDLALRHYAADGQTLLGGPFYQPGYLSHLDGGITAKVHVTGDAVFVAAPRLSASGRSDMAFLKFDKATGLTLVEKVWRAADGSSSYPVAILPEATGLLVAGGIGDDFTDAGLWRFGYDGGFLSATTADAGGAQGAVFKGGELWLSVDGSTVPYHVLSESASAGTFVDISTRAAQALTSIALTPTDAFILAGAKVQFTAAGMFTDGSTRTLTSAEIAWSTDVSSVATVSAAGLVTGVSAGAARVIASTGAASGFASLTVSATYFVAASSDGAAFIASSRADATITPVSSDTVAAAYAAAVGQNLVLRMSSLYELSPSPIVFDPPALLTFWFDPPGVDTAAVAIYRFNGAAWDPAPITGQQIVSLEGGQLAISGTLNSASLYAVFSLSPPTLEITSISPTSGANAGPVTVSVSGSGIVDGAALELNRILAGGSGFTTSGTLTAARLEAAAVRLANGKVLIAGGQDYNTGGIFSSADVFDPQTGNWSPTGAMAVPRYLHTMTLLPDGKVLAVGGASCSNCTPLNTAELYDPASGTWSYTGSLAAVRALHTATTLGSGKVLIAGGGSVNNADFIKSSAELYDPATNAWTSAGVMPSGGHFWHSAAALPDGRVVVAGGRNSSILLTAAVDIYSPATNTWSPAAPMSNTRSRFTLDVLPNGKLMATGGDAGVPLASTEIYDPAAGTWTAGASLSSMRAVHTSARLSDGKILVIGGFGSAGFVSAAELFDPAASSWTTVGSLARIGHTETALADGSILIAGGRNSSGPSATSIYSPASQSIAASNLTYSGGNVIGGVFDLAGQSVGLWDVVVTNPDQSSSRLSNAFTIHDTVPPNAVSDLAISALDASPATLTWTAPGGQGGAVASYDLRRATVPITTDNFFSAAAISAPTPAAPGTLQTGSVLIDSDSSVFVALRSQDIYGNVSSISNVASLARSTALVNGVPEASIWTTQPVSVAMSSSDAAALQAAAQGLTQASSIYDPSPKSVTFAGGANVSFTFDPATLSAQGIPAESLRIYQFVGGTLVAISSQTLSGQTLTASVASFTGDMGLFGVVPAPTLTAISPALGGNGGTLDVSVSGTGIIVGARLELNRILAGGSGFTTSGELALRVAGTAVRLANGKVLIAGGNGNISNDVFATAELFDPNTGSWSATGSMATRRVGHTMTLLPDGKVLVVGGTTCLPNCDTAVNSAEVYDPASGTWSFTSGPLAHVRINHTATLLPSGKVLVAGGGNTNNADLIKSSAELYDPATGLWTSAGIMPSGGHFWHGAAALPDGRVVVAGGRNSSILLTAAVDIYNPATNTWSPAAPMSNTRSRYTLDLLPNGKLMATGGDAGVPLDSTEIYDPAPGAGTWTAGASLSSKRSSHASARLSDGKILVIGGFAGSAGYVAAAELFDPALSSWTTVGSLKRLNHTVTALADGSILIAGGFDPSGPSATSIYSPASLSIVASNLTYSGGNTISGVLDLTGQSVGLWDVVVTNPNRLSARLSNEFTIHGSAPPSAVADLALSSIGLSTVTLQWTAPASPSGALASYEIRFASFPLDSENFASGTSVTGPAPAAPGTAQTVSIGGLDGATAFYAALKSQDIFGNVSSLSNVASWARSTTFVEGQPEFTFSAGEAVTVVPVSTFTFPGSVVLATSTAQGLTLVSSIYDLGPEGAVFNPYAQMTFVYSPDTLASLGLLPSDMKIYQYVPGAGMVEVSSQTIDTAANTITGYVPSLSSIFAVFGVVKDRTAPVSTASIGSPLYISAAGVELISSATPVTLSAIDPVVAGVASGVERIEVSVDGGAFAAYASALTFAEGRRVLLFRAVDRAGNRETDKTLELLVDATTPLTARSLSGGFEFTDADGSLFVSSGARLAFTADDPVPTLPGALASGVAFTQYRLDAAPSDPFATFVSSLVPLAVGRHTVAYRSQDNVGNLETTRTLAITYDAAAPVIAITAPAAGSYVAAKSTIPVSFTVADNFDPAPAVSAVLTQIEDRGSPRGARPAVVAVTSGQMLDPLSLDDGLWQLSVSATDFVRNAAAAAGAAFEVVHDTLAPRSTLAVGAPQASGGPGGSLFVTRDTLFTLSSIDDLVDSNDAAGLGVSFQELMVDAAPRARFLNASPASGQTFTSTFTLSADGDGTHALSYYASDVLANREAERAASVAVDNTAPLTTLVATGGEQYPGPDAITYYASSATRINLAAADPPVNWVASGVELTQYQDNGGVLQTFTDPFGLAEGSHALSYRSRDRVQNLEATRGSTVLVDATAPATTAGAGAPHFVGADGARYVTPASAVTFSAADPALPGGQPGSGVDRVELSLDGAAFMAVSSTLTLAEGRHTLLYRALDNVGNAEVERSLELRSDATPPVTTAQIGSSLFTAADGTNYISPATPISFSAVDPLVGDVASGVQRVEVAVDGGAFAAQTAPLTLAEGRHTVLYRAVDNVGNVEATRTLNVQSDATAPASTADIGSPSFTAADGVRYVTPATPVTILAADPLAANVASGVERIEVSLNGGAFAAYAAALTFAEGRHSVRFRAIDNVGNVESARTLELRSDATPPLTALAATGAYFITTDALGERRYAPQSFSYTLPATDPVVSDVASGLAFTRYRTGQVLAGQFVSDPLQPYLGAFTLAEGVRRVEFESADNVGNAEALKGETVAIDASAPVTSLSVGEPRYDAGAGQPVIISPLTTITLASVDPIVQEVASGVRAVEFRRDAEPFSAYAAPFSLPLPDGVKTVEWSATDNVGNAEAARSRAVALDATAPMTSLAVLGGAPYPGPDAWTFYASPATRYGLTAADPVVNGIASGVDRTEYQDNGAPFQSFGAAFALTEGSHALAYRSSDRVGNLEVARSTTVLVDATPPVTSVLIGAPLHVALDGPKYLTPATPISFSAVDPRLTGTLVSGSGVRRIEVAVDGAPFASYSSALLLAEGRHTILYRSVDNVGNVEAERSLAVQSDATPPASTLAVGSPQHQLPDALLVSTRTLFSLAALDPLSNHVASGVKDSFYRVSDVLPGSGVYQTYAAAFTLGGADVRNVIEFYSRDNVLNVEAVKSGTVLLDSTPPEVALLSPASCDSGICRVLKGKFPVLGTAQDRHFQSYALEFAPGKDASAGFALISSGTVAVSSGTLGVWDASALGGWQTLRLTANDLVRNGTVLALNVFVGDPATLLVLGGHDTFNMPEGVAVGVDGKIYVADRNNDRVAVFSSTGAALASFGGRGREDGDDDPRPSTSTLRLKRPAAVAVDAAGSIFVADTGNHRVLKLSPAGQVLLDIGRRKTSREDDKEKAERKVEFKAGAGPGEFKSPSGIAVDAEGRIHVSDTDNHRVQVFSSTGVFALAFDLPPVPEAPEGDDERGAKDDDDDRPRLGKPVGIALDLAANIYVADAKGRRALAFDAAGRLLMTVPVLGRKGRSVAQPVGIAVSPSGDCLLVSDQQSGRILKYDFHGNLNLAFGGKRRGDEGERRASSIKLRKPAGLAMDAEGALYVADRNDVRIKKFSLPDGSATVFAPAQGPEDDDIAREVIDREDGGLVERKDRAAVSIPPDALPEDLRISVTTPTATVAAESRRGADDKNMKVASQPVEFQPHGTEFEKPVTLTIPYNPELLAAQNAGDADLKVHYWNPKTKAWEELDSTVDNQSRTVTAKTTHFSLYQVFTGTSAPAALSPLAADPGFGMKAAYAFPNPARGVSAATIRVQPGLADSLEVRIYDASGRKVHSSSNFRGLGAFDDGNGLGAQFTYEHVWDLSGVGSGVYAYVITVRKSGERDIHRSGKLGVVK